MKSLALAILAFLVTANGALAFWDIQALAKTCSAM